jgi:hypothetical protein
MSDAMKDSLRVQMNEAARPFATPATPAPTEQHAEGAMTRVEGHRSLFMTGSAHLLLNQAHIHMDALDMVL